MFFPQMVDYFQYTGNRSGSGVVWQLTSDRDGLTEYLVLSITKVATSGENTKRSMTKVAALDFPLLFNFITFTIVNVNKNPIFGKVALNIVVVIELYTLNMYMVFKCFNCAIQQMWDYYEIGVHFFGKLRQ